MPHYNIVIETREMGAGWSRAEVVKGPAWARSSTMHGRADGPSAEVAYDNVRKSLRKHYTAHTFDFMHVKV